MQKAWLGVTLAAAVVSIGGCDGKKADECAAILAVANKDIAALKAAAATRPAGGGKDAATATRATADAADKIAVDLSKKGPTTAELQKFSGDYQAMAKAISAAARDYADIADHLATIEPKTHADVAPAVKSLTTANDKLKQQCTDHHVFECKVIASMTANVMTLADKPAELDKLEVDLGKLKIKDPTVTALLQTLRGSMNALAKTIRDAADAAVEMKEIQTKLTAAGAALDAALAKEAPLTTSVNAFCSK